ncbi:MAG: response regulator [Christiangramia sp.]|nr:response regulator [Christiangramia sp.]
MIVDDERDMEALFRQKFRRDLKNRHLQMVFAFSGREAIEMLQENDPPEVMYVLSDINMPGMTGIELLQKIKELYPTIMVSMISAYGDSENYNKAINSGAKQFFTKPLDFDSLREEINTIMN